MIENTTDLGLTDNFGIVPKHYLDLTEVVAANLNS